MPRPIRVALIATSINFGGIEKVLLNLVRYMGPGVEFVPVVFTRTDAREHTFFEHLTALSVPHATFYVNAFKPKYVNAAYNVREAIGVLKDRQIDLVHSHGYRADVIGLLLAKYLRLPLVSTCHGFIHNDRRLRFYNGLDAFLLRYFSRVIAVSEQMKADIVASGVASEKVSVITNAVSTGSSPDGSVERRAIRSRLNVENDDFVFGYVGRLSDEKGLAHLLQAAGRLMAEKPAVHLVLVGEGPQRSELEDSSRALGLNGHVHFAGFQSETSSWFQAMDAFVLPSLTEGTPMALLEAMAHQLPAIGTSVGGVPAVVSHQKTGLLVPPGDPSALLDAMRLVASDEDLRDALGKTGLKSVQDHYDVSAWATRVRDLYVDALEERRPTS